MKEMEGLDPDMTLIPPDAVSFHNLIPDFFNAVSKLKQFEDEVRIIFFELSSWSS